MTTTTTETVTCGKCDGRGTLSWTRNANGVCFACGGAGKLLVDLEARKAIRAPRAENIAAIARCLEACASDDSVSDDFYALAYHIARAEDDVAARAMAAVEKRIGPGTAHNLGRQVEANRTAAIVRNVRKVA